MENAREKVLKEFNWEVIGKKTMAVYKDTIKAAKAANVKVKFEEKQNKEIVESIEENLAITAEKKDTTITTSSTDSEIRGILPNPLRNLKKVTN